MSDDRDRQETDDEAAPPMLVLGENGPDVEDTTLEELRRQREELLREQAEAERRIQAERDRLEEELAAERRRTEQELVERQRRIDDAERDLIAAERRVRRQAERTGQAHQVPRVSPSATPLPPRGRLRSKGPAGLLAVVVAASTLGALLLTGSPPSQDQVQEFSTLAEGHLVWDEATQALDALIVTRMQDSGAPPSEQTTQQAEAAAQEVLRLVEEAHDLAPLYYHDGTERVVTAVESIASDDSLSAVRALTHWEDGRYSTTNGAEQYLMSRRAESMLPASTPAWWLLSLSLLAVGAMIVLAVRNRAYLALAMLGLASVTGVASMVFLGLHSSMGELADAVEERQEAERKHDALSRSQARDLETIFGMQRGSSTGEDYWSRDWYHDLDDVPIKLTREFWQVRQGFATLDPQEQLAQAPELLEALEPLLEYRREQRSRADEALVDAASDPPGSAPLVGFGLLTAALAAGAVFAPSHQPDRLRTSPTPEPRTSSTPRARGERRRQQQRKR